MCLPATWGGGLAVISPFACAFVIRRRFHRQPDAFTRGVDFHDGDRDDLTGLDHLTGVFDELVGQLGNMDQAILMHTNIDKRAEIGDVGDGSFKLHTGFQVLDFIDTIGEFGGLEFRARVTAGFIKLGNNIADGWHTECVVGVIFGTQRFDKGRIAD